MKEKKVIIIAITLFIIISSLYFSSKYLATRYNTQNFNVDTTGLDLIHKEEDDLLKTYDASTLEKMETSNNISSANQLVLFMFSSVIYEKPFFFSSCFEGEQITKDLADIDQSVKEQLDGDEVELFRYLTKKISREDKLENVHLLNSSNNFLNGKTKVKVRLEYSDKKETTLSLSVKAIESGDRKTSYVITTPVWDIIKTVERK